MIRDPVDTDLAGSIASSANRAPPFRLRCGNQHFSPILEYCETGDGRARREVSYAENSDCDRTSRIAARGDRTPIEAVGLPHGAGSKTQ